ncbi:MAG TPA: Rab family GTPase [Candidatus Lokiarchaeia archaeon]|nr:Rab family GTPase [Candidatus Lokiarchaeia archaeon]
MSDSPTNVTDKAHKMREDLLKELERLKTLYPRTTTKTTLPPLPRNKRHHPKNLPKFQRNQLHGSNKDAFVEEEYREIPLTRDEKTERKSKWDENEEVSLETLQQSANYYLEYYGFDPNTRKIKISKGYKYEEFFPLKNDPELEREGISIGARVEVTDRLQTVKNRIVFTKGKGKKEAIVNCVHTALYTLDAAEALVAGEDQILDLAKSSESVPIQLPPEDHFVSLRSYVDGIASIGIRNIIGASYFSQEMNPETLPFGFNSAMQRQIIKALRQLAPAATHALVRDVIMELAETVPPEWFDSRILLLDQIYNIKDIILTEPAVFEAIDSETSSRNLRILAVHYPNTDPAILETIKQDEHYEEYLQQAGPLTGGAAGLAAPLYVFKIAVLGDEGSGRNSLCRRFSGHFNDPLARSLEFIGASFGFRDFNYPTGESVRLLLCNFSGNERFRYILADYSLGSAGALICYDVTEIATFNEIPKLVALVREKNEQIPICLVGCKFDRDPAEHQVTKEMADRLTEELNCVDNFMTSAQTGFNVEEVLQAIAEWLLNNVG